MSATTESFPRRHKLTVNEYYRMAEAGLLAQDARVELIQGEIIDMAPIGSRHAAVVNELVRLFTSVVAGQAIVSIQAPVRLGLMSEPQPDISLLKPRADKYSQAHPGAADVLLLVEVSDTTLRYDRQTKIPLYAAHGIEEAWIVDLESKKLHVFREPINGEYASACTFDLSSTIFPLKLRGVSLSLAALLQLLE